VRGLDYYRHIAFEFVTDRLGAQGTVLGGGRYDGLIENLGGRPTPAVGWAAGIERLAMLIDAPDAPAVQLVLIPDEESDTPAAVRLLSILRSDRERPIRADMAFGGSSKKRYEKAKRSTAERALTVTTGNDPGFAIVCIRDLQTDAAPVRAQLREVLDRAFEVVEDEQTREFRLYERS
jgi:histidyl-tRNA synthetase